MQEITRWEKIAFLGLYMVSALTTYKGLTEYSDVLSRNFIYFMAVFFLSFGYYFIVCRIDLKFPEILGRKGFREKLTFFISILFFWGVLFGTSTIWTVLYLADKTPLEKEMDEIVIQLSKEWSPVTEQYVILNQIDKRLETYAISARARAKNEKSRYGTGPHYALNMGLFDEFKKRRKSMIKNLRSFNEKYEKVAKYINKINLHSTWLRPEKDFRKKQNLSASIQDRNDQISISYLEYKNKFKALLLKINHEIGQLPTVLTTDDITFSRQKLIGAQAVLPKILKKAEKSGNAQYEARVRETMADCEEMLLILKKLESNLQGIGGAKRAILELNLNNPLEQLFKYWWPSAINHLMLGIGIDFMPYLIVFFHGIFLAFSRKQSMDAV